MKQQKLERAYGTWPSQLSATDVARGSRRFGRVQVFHGIVYWSESRPEENGRNVIMRGTSKKDVETVLPAGFSAKSRVHEYGGGEFLVTELGIFFVNDEDQDIYHIDSEDNIGRVTDASEFRFADFIWDNRFSRLISVAERHTTKAEKSESSEIGNQPENLLVAAVPPVTWTKGSRVDDIWNILPLKSGCDFYASPKISPDGGTLVWLSWNLPNMPWETARLSISHFEEDGQLSQTKHLDAVTNSAIFQPEWTSGGHLLFVSDLTGWGNLHVYSHENVKNLNPCNCEYGRPLWSLATTSYALLKGDKIIASCYDSGDGRTHIVDPDTSSVEPLDLGLRSFDMVDSWNNVVAGIGATDHEPAAIVKFTVSEEASSELPVEVLRSASENDKFPEEISDGLLLEFAGNNKQQVFGLYYPPANSSYKGTAAALPPVMITVHGGPTGMADRGFKIKTQYWTSRGFGVFDIDYSGSFGYGKAYRKRLDNNWGVKDVEDVVAGVQMLKERGLADPNKIVISGGSAGGFTVLMALALSDVFAAGASYYGVCDLLQLQNITHKFESGYLYGLLGTEPGTCEQVYKDRSPLYNVQDITSPVILFQGLKDKVVPADQSRSMVKSLVENKVPTAYLEFENEGHGFREAQTLIDSLSLEYEFYARFLDLDIESSLSKIDRLIELTNDRFR